MNFRSTSVLVQGQQKHGERLLPGEPGHDVVADRRLPLRQQRGFRPLHRAGGLGRGRGRGRGWLRVARHVRAAGAGLGVCAHLRLLGDRHHARVPPEALRGPEDPHVPVRPLPAAVGLHQDLDRPVCGGPLRAHLPGLELLPLHLPHAPRHRPLHHRRGPHRSDLHGRPADTGHGAGSRLPERQSFRADRRLRPAGGSLRPGRARQDHRQHQLPPAAGGRHAHVPRRRHGGPAVDRHDLRPDRHGHLVLVHRPGHRAAVAVGPRPEPRQGGLHPRRLPQDAPHGSHGHARHDQPRALPRRRGLRGARRVPAGLRRRDRLLQHRLPQAGPGADAHGSAGTDDRRDAGRARVLPDLHLQQQQLPLHHGHLEAAAAPRGRAGAAAGGTAGRRGPGRRERGLDPRPAGLQRRAALPLHAVGHQLPGAPGDRRLSPGHLLASRQRAGRLLGPDGGAGGGRRAAGARAPAPAAPLRPAGPRARRPRRRPLPALRGGPLRAQRGRGGGREPAEPAPPRPADREPHLVDPVSGRAPGGQSRWRPGTPEARVLGPRVRRQRRAPRVRERLLLRLLRLTRPPPPGRNGGPGWGDWSPRGHPSFLTRTPRSEAGADPLPGHSEVGAPGAAQPAEPRKIKGGSRGKELAVSKESWLERKKSGLRGQPHSALLRPRERRGAGRGAGRG
nr:sodium/mannose cotransporter SLC5A10 isoform X1 [Dasypus novemcinctus]